MGGRYLKPLVTSSASGRKTLASLVLMRFRWLHAQALQQATQLRLTHALIKTAARATAATNESLQH